MLATIIAIALVPGLRAAPAQAADSDPDLDVTITSLSPSWLKAGADVTMRGTVKNNDDHAWKEVQAYLVIPTGPFTTRAQIDEAIDTGDTGTRVVDAGTFDELGDLAPGQLASFEVKVPYQQLGISGGAGIYPVGVQLLGTDTDGTRSTSAIARATTFLPNIPADQPPVATTVVWPFLAPDYIGADGNYNDPLATLTAISANGRLRNLLDLAASTPERSSTVLIDPALLVAVDDIANQRHVAESDVITEVQAAEASRFLQDFLTYARSENDWILDYDRPDVLALADYPDLRSTLVDAADRATQSALTTYQLTGRRVIWPTKKGVTASLLAALRGDGETPVIVTPGSVPGWERRLGSIVGYESTRGRVPLLVNDVLDAGVPGGTSVVTLRQRILSDAALAGLQRAIDPRSRADAVTMVDPSWNPGSATADAALASAFQAPFTAGATLDDQLTQPVKTYNGKVPATTTVRTLGRAQLQAASDLAHTGDALSSMISGDAEVDDRYSREVAGLLGVRWRLDPGTGVAVATARAQRATAELAKITVEGPPSVTLSSSSGGFPLTITNDTADDVRVGVVLESSNPALNFSPVEPVEISAGERHTLTVNIDLDRQNTTQLTAHLTSPDGTRIGATDVFNVRSSKIGVVLWVALGLAGVLVLVALFRRFHRRRNGDGTKRPADDD